MNDVKPRTTSEPSTTLLSPFLTTEGRPRHRRQCGKQQPSFNRPQPPPNNNNSVAIPHHTTPNDAANNKDEQPTTMATHDRPLTKTNQHQSNQPQASIRTMNSTHNGHRLQRAEVRQAHVLLTTHRSNTESRCHVAFGDVSAKRKVVSCCVF